SNPKPEAPAPKGFFDDIPGLPSNPKPEVPAPKGFFDDIPGLSKPPRADPAPRGFFDDRPPPGRSTTERPAVDAVELQLTAGPEPDVGSLPASASPPVAARSSGTFDDFDLSRPSSPVRFESPTRPSAPRAVQADARGIEPGPVLELEAPRPGAPPPVARRPGKDESVARPGAERRTRNRAAVVALIILVALAAGGF